MRRPPADHGTECNREVAALRKLYKTIPTDFRNTRESIAKITDFLLDIQIDINNFIDAWSHL